MQTPLHALLWVLAIMAGFGLVRRRDLHHAGRDGVRGELLLRRDRRRGRACRTIRPIRPAWRCRCARAGIEGIKTALLALLVYLCAVPFLLFAGFGFLIFFVANAYLLGREYFLLAAMRFHSVEDAKALRKPPSRHDRARRRLHRGVRVDPDPQSGDAAVRHGVHDAHAQEDRRAAARADRAYVALSSARSSPQR